VPLRDAAPLFIEERLLRIARIPFVVATEIRDPLRQRSGPNEPLCSSSSDFSRAGGLSKWG